LVYNDKAGLGRLYWYAFDKRWVMVYERPTQYKTQDEAESVVASMLSHIADLSAWSRSGIGVVRATSWQS